MHDMKNIIFAYISTCPTLAAAVENPTPGSIVAAFLFSFLLMLFGKLADFAIRLYLYRRAKTDSGPAPRCRDAAKVTRDSKL